MDREQYEKKLPKKQSSIDLKHVLTLKKSRPEHPEDKPAADFIQHYGLSAVRCFEKGENPTLALMALMPFKLGEFSLGEELHTLLFSQSEANPQAQIQAFGGRFEQILDSIVRFHADPANDPYLVQTAMGLQMLIQAAMAKLSTLDRQVFQVQFTNRLANRLFTVEIEEKTIEEGNILTYPARKLLNPRTEEQAEIVAHYKSYDNEFVKKSDIETQPAEDAGPSATSLEGTTKLNAAGELAKKNQFTEALTAIETTLRSAKKNGWGNFLRFYIDNQNRYASIDAILNSLKDDVSPEKQAFALAVLNKILKHGPDEISLLFQHPGLELLKTLLLLKPKNAEATLLLGNIFETLANNNSRTYRYYLNLIAYTQQSAQKVRSSNTSIVIGSLAVIVAIIIFILAATAFPLLPLYITGAVVGSIGTILALTGIFIKIFTPSTLTPTPTNANELNSPMIQKDLKTWLEAYGYYGAIEEKTFFSLFEHSSALCDAIDVQRDFAVFRPFLENGKSEEEEDKDYTSKTWDDIVPLLEKSFSNHKIKIVELITHDATVFKNLVNTVDQLEQLNKWITEATLHRSVTAIKAIGLESKIWAFITDDKNFKILIENGCAPVPEEIQLPGTIGLDYKRQQPRTYTPDPYEKLIKIFGNNPEKIQFLEGKKAARDAAAHGNVLQTEAPPAKQIVKEKKEDGTPSPTPTNTQDNTQNKPKQF